MRMFCRSSKKRWGITVATIVGMYAGGCASSRNDATYLSEPNVSYYRGHATEIDFPAVEAPIVPEVIQATAPVTVRDLENLPVRELTLSESVQTALLNSQIIRNAGTFLSTGNTIYTNPDRIASVYDPAIQETGVLFGGRGVEAALSAFDAQLQSSMVWGRNETPTNNAFLGGGIGAGNALIQETGQFTSSLSKSFAHGGAISLNHNVNYLGTNSPSLFQSAYSGNVQLQYQLPLLAGAGTEFTRIAGPIGQAFGGLTGVSQGVLIARINNDLTIADFEVAVRNMVRDVENSYWDLYLAYQQFDIAVQTREYTKQLRRYIELRVSGGAREVTPADLYQADDQYFAAETAVTNAQSQIYQAEIRLRRLMGLPTSDGVVLRPQESPTSAELVPDWNLSLTEALTHRVELRRQKWNIKSLELQLTAAESLTRPRLDFVGGYQVNGFGDDLLGYDEPNFGNYYETISNNNYTGWNLGLQFRWDIGFRSAKAQVQNYEIRLAKACRVLEEQEEEISHELSSSFQELARAYRATEVSYNRMSAVQAEVATRRERDRTVDPPDLLLRAIIRQAEAQSAYYQNLVDYNIAILDFQLRKGVLLEQHGIRLAEGGWEADAYDDAKFHSDQRLFAEPNEHLYQQPPAFANDAPYGGVYVEPNLISPESATPLSPAPGELFDPPTAAPVPPSTKDSNLMGSPSLPSPNQGSQPTNKSRPAQVAPTPPAGDLPPSDSGDSVSQQSASQRTRGTKSPASKSNKVSGTDRTSQTVTPAAASAVSVGGGLQTLDLWRVNSPK